MKTITSTGWRWCSGCAIPPCPKWQFLRLLLRFGEYARKMRLFGGEWVCVQVLGIHQACSPLPPVALLLRWAAPVPYPHIPGSDAVYSILFDTPPALLATISGLYDTFLCTCTPAPHCFGKLTSGFYSVAGHSTHSSYTFTAGTCRSFLARPLAVVTVYGTHPHVLCHQSRRIPPSERTTDSSFGSIGPQIQEYDNIDAVEGSQDQEVVEHATCVEARI
ncbi:hypothetical protein B0H10DRAFT_1944882 [Mycena sp. CBHHK59/15]|nr:hypothetical protein B0H10DRAFT_1944882 [Mycena sp. CBHHK59/15]